MLDFCFNGIKLHRVTAACDSRNVAACRLLERAGMRREGEFLKDHFADGAWFNTVSYAVLSEDCCKGNDRPTPRTAT
jgi:RimJ/RimL family protein N-acetyltransferase